MAKKIMIQGTMSNSGKSFVAAALCRIFRQDGYRTAPFKSQNMALNSYITRDGLEMGRAQVMQAEAAGVEPEVDMNPILLKPTSHTGSQVIVRGEVYGNMRAMEYYRRKTEFIPVIREAFGRLDRDYDVVVLEGAGSPAEINLRDNDIVNMGMAEMADSPVLLVGDIDRGGVFASLYGTVSLLREEERRRVKGMIINKFRGDVKILEPGLHMIEDLLHIPVVGVIPMEQIDLDDEDSLSERLEQDGGPGGLDIAVIRLPHISNFTDFNILEQRDGVSLRYVSRASGLGCPDLVILPGTKNTMADLKWLRESGLEASVLRLAGEGTAVIGICGGYQMLGRRLTDPDGVEGGGSMAGMGLLDAETVFAPRKTRTRIAGVVQAKTGFLAGCAGLPVCGYEIHMGVTRSLSGGGGHVPAILLEDGREDGLAAVRGSAADSAAGRGAVLGSYLHGLFDNEELTDRILGNLAEKKGICLGERVESREAYKQRQYDKLADLVRRSLDMEQICRIMGMKE